jgi:hypothetical protein
VFSETAKTLVRVDDPSVGQSGGEAGSTPATNLVWLYLRERSEGQRGASFATQTTKAHFGAPLFASLALTGRVPAESPPGTRSSLWSG